MMSSVCSVHMDVMAQAGSAAAGRAQGRTASRADLPRSPCP